MAKTYATGTFVIDKYYDLLTHLMAFDTIADQESISRYNCGLSEVSY